MKFGSQWLEALPQVQDGIALAGEQRVHVFAGEGGDVLKRHRVELVPHENLTLLLRQLGERRVQLLPKLVKQMLRSRRLVLAQEKPGEIEPGIFPFGVAGHRLQRGHLRLPVTIDDPVAGDGIKPGTDLLDGTGFERDDKLLPDFLGNVLRIGVS